MKKIFLILSITLMQSATANSSGKVTPPAESKKAATKPVAEAQLDSETRQVLKIISEKYQKLQNWEASFSEETFSVALGTGSFNEGNFVFSAPDKFRYSLMSPQASDFISDGKSAWQVVYREGRGKPAYVRHFTDIRQVELSKYLIFLRGIGKFTPEKEKELTRDFEVKGKVVQDELQLILEPRTASNLTRIILVFKQGGSAPNKAILEDSLGNRTTITLKKHKVLRSPSPKIFKPDYPKGSKVEVL